MNDETQVSEAKEELHAEIVDAAEEALTEEAELTHVKAENEALKIQLAVAKNDYYKAYADAENRKKRLQQDFDTNMKYRAQSFVMDVLPALDNFERALSQDVCEEAEAYVKGFQMIYDQLMSALQKEGVEMIEAQGVPFDANVHHAIMTAKEDDIAEGIVLQELQKGYKLKDRILRASMVKVSE